MGAGASFSSAKRVRKNLLELENEMDGVSPSLIGNVRLANVVESPWTCWGGYNEGKSCMGVLVYLDNVAACFSNVCIPTYWVSLIIQLLYTCLKMKFGLSTRALTGAAG